jgi:hypothetical protein
MAQREFSMHIRFNTDKPEQFDTIQKIMIRAAREIYTSATLVAGHGSPVDIKLFTDDFTMGTTELDAKDEVKKLAAAEQAQTDDERL